VKVFSAEQLARFESTRDTRSRLDLVTDAETLKADRIVYHPGDSSARHYHVGSDQLFVVLAGDGIAHLGDETRRLRAGDTAVARGGELHWFENDRDEDFVFVEFWAPPPTETVWVDTGDV
jgi:quercetin dioxygenase-like cupin family protein